MAEDASGWMVVRRAARLVLVVASRRSEGLTPRRGLVYDAVSIRNLSWFQRRRNATWLVMH